MIWLQTIQYTGNGIRRGLNMISNARRSLQVAATLADRPDVVIGPSVPLGTGWAAARIAEKTGAAFVFEVHDVWPTILVDDGGLSKRNPVYHVFRAMEKSLYRRAQRISSTLPFLFDHVAASGSDPRKVTWVPNGVDFRRFAGHEKYGGGTSGQLTVMYVGGFGVAHDVFSILRAAKILHEAGETGFRFVFVGNGPKKSGCQAEANAAGLRNIEFRDPVPKDMVPVIQTEADVLVASVTESDSYWFGLNLNKLFDYFASSRPVVFSGKAPNDLVREANAGFSIPPEDPLAMAEALRMLRALGAPARIAMGERGRRYVEDNFDMRMLGERMESLLRQAIQAKGA